MKACVPMSADGTCWRRRCLRCRWNNVTGQSRRRKEALLRRMDEFRALTAACDHDFQPAWMVGDRQFLTCAKRCGTLTVRL